MSGDVGWPEDVRRLREYPELKAAVTELAQKASLLAEATAELRQQVAEVRAENERLRAELDTVQRLRVVLCPPAGISAAMDDLRGEQPGTILRESAAPHREWALQDGGSWQQKG